MAIDRWMDREDVVHLYTMEYYSAIKKNKNAIYSNMDETRYYHTKLSKSERERQMPYVEYGIPLYEEHRFHL